MKPIAWVEILDRHGEIASRHPVHAFPFRIGRAYACDVVIDDPYIAGEHLEVDTVGEGGYHINDMDSLNGMTTDAQRGKQSQANISPENVVRIGHTQFRIRPANFAVAVEKHLPVDSWIRRWSALLIAAPFLMLVYFNFLWSGYDRAESYKLLLQPMLFGPPMVLVWIVFWAFVRHTHSVVNFVAHAVIACFGFGTLMLIDEPLIEYVGFAFNSRIIAEVLSLVLEPLVIGTMLYHHVRLVSRSSRRKLGIVVAMLTVACTVIFYMNDKLSDENDFTNMSYSRTVAPPAVLMVNGMGSEEFVAGAGRLKARVDE